MAVLHLKPSTAIQPVWFSIKIFSSLGGAWDQEGARAGPGATIYCATPPNIKKSKTYVNEVIFMRVTKMNILNNQRIILILNLGYIKFATNEVRPATDHTLFPLTTASIPSFQIGDAMLTPSSQDASTKTRPPDAYP